jgi:hypothetical protein
MGDGSWKLGVGSEKKVKSKKYKVKSVQSQWSVLRNMS